jgi:hypothetical protein
MLYYNFYNYIVNLRLLLLHIIISLLAVFLNFQRHFNVQLLYTYRNILMNIALLLMSYRADFSVTVTMMNIDILISCFIKTIITGIDLIADLVFNYM